MFVFQPDHEEVSSRTEKANITQQLDSLKEQNLDHHLALEDSISTTSASEETEDEDETPSDG